MKGYLALSISIICEIFATAMLKMSEGFTVLFPSVGVIIGYGLAFYCLSLCLKTLPLSLAYAMVWCWNCINSSHRGPCVGRGF